MSIQFNLAMDEIRALDDGRPMHLSQEQWLQFVAASKRQITNAIDSGECSGEEVLVLKMALAVDHTNHVKPTDMAARAAADLKRFKLRCGVKDDIIASFATENLERVREKVWTAGQLSELMQSALIRNIVSNISALSFEVAIDVIESRTNTQATSIVTPVIARSWMDRIEANLFLD